MKHWMWTAALAAALIACDSADPVDVPDLVGLTLEEAREHADTFELKELDASGQDRGVWSASSWTVDGQDPAAGTPAERGSTVTVQLVNVRDESEPSEPSEADEPAEPDEPAETDAPAEAAPDASDTTDDLDPIAQVEQAYDWFTEERVPIDVDYDIWVIQGAVDSITGYQIVGTSLLVETGLHPDNPDSDWIARGLCGVASSSLYDTSIQRVEVEASNGSRIARCDVFQ